MFNNPDKIFTGTLGKKMTMNEDNPEKNDVRLPGLV